MKTDGTAGMVTWFRAQLDERERHVQFVKEAAVRRSHYRKEVVADCAVDLADIEAKRRIVDLLANAERVLAEAEADAWTPGVNKLWLGGRRSALRGVVRELALSYADRPGYREEWRPGYLADLDEP